MQKLRFFRRISYALLILTSFKAFLLTISAAATEIEAHYFNRPPRMDGTLNDPIWGDATRVTYFTQFHPREGERATESTLALIGYDKKNLYVAFFARDSRPSLIRGHMVPRDQIDTEDYVGIILDTFGDERRAYELFSNPRGIQEDLFNNGGNEDITPDYVWYTAASIRTYGYVVEMKIPFKSLRFSLTPEQKWRLTFFRNIERKNEWDVWPSYKTDRGSFLSQMADVSGIREANPGRRIEINPEMTTTYAVPFERQDNAFHIGDTNLRLGGNLKYGLTPNWTLDSTYNPDFSQVEADLPQIQVNQRYPLFFPEKRPFFMEGADLFSTPLFLVNTRTIVDPEYGAKVTGEEGPFTAGLLRARDRSQNGSSFDIAHMTANVGEESKIGAIYSGRDLSGGQYNRVAGVDGLLRFDKIYVFDFQGVDSFTNELATGTIQGPAYHAALSRDVTRGFGFTFSYNDYSPHFEADSGFVPRINMRQGQGNLSYAFWPGNGFLQTITPSVVYTRIYDHANVLTDAASSGAISFLFPLQTQLSMDYYPRTLERFDGINFYKRKADASLASEPFSWLAGSVTATKGDAIYYQGSPPFLGNDLEGAASLTVRPTSRLSCEELYLKSRLDAKTGARVFDENIWRHKITFQWTKEISSRVIYQYDTLNHDGFSESLLTYTLVPGTSAYVGYNWSFARNPTLLMTTQRLIFGKISYLFRI